MLENKTIWIIDQYAMTPETGKGGGARHYLIAKELSKIGHKVCVISAGYHHLLGNLPNLNSEFTIEERDENFDFVWVKMPKYGHAHDKKRVFNWFLFSFKLLRLSKVLSEKPDVILASSPAPFVSIPAKVLAKKLQAKLIFEVRDIWPLTLIQLGGYKPSHPFIRLMQYVEDKAYKSADMVFSNLPYAVDHMESRGMNRNKFTWIPNGYSFADLENSEELPSEIIDQIPLNKFIVGYAGTHGFANSLDSFIDAAELLKDQKDLVVLLVGDGKEKNRLMDKAKNMENVVFIDSLPKTQVQSMLKYFDICYIATNNDPLYKFGIAPNKIPEYMFASKPILLSYSGKGDAVTDGKAGLCVPSEDVKAIANGIMELKSKTSEELKLLGENGNKYALLNFNYEHLAKKMISVFFAKK